MLIDPTTGSESSPEVPADEQIDDELLGKISGGKEGGGIIRHSKDMPWEDQDTV
jgi:hypothetical protein